MLKYLRRATLQKNVPQGHKDKNRGFKNIQIQIIKILKINGKCLYDFQKSALGL